MFKTLKTHKNEKKIQMKIMQHQCSSSNSPIQCVFEKLFMQESRKKLQPKTLTLAVDTTHTYTHIIHHPSRKCNAYFSLTLRVQDKNLIMQIAYSIINIISQIQQLVQCCCHFYLHVDTCYKLSIHGNINTFLYTTWL